jgi:hypothetical protein
MNNDKQKLRSDIPESDRWNIEAMYPDEAHLNDDISITNEISIISDPYANKNFHSMRYVKFMGTAWKVNSIEVQYPRLILSLGGEFYAQQT